jgi:hypothetical protein
MSARVKKYLKELKTLRRACPKKRRLIINDAPPEMIDCISECAMNCLNNAVKLTKGQFTKLRRHKSTLRKLASKRVSRKTKKQALNQTGGFLAPLLTAILTALASRLLQ